MKTSTVYIEGLFTYVHSQRINTGYHRIYKISCTGVEEFPVSSFNEVSRDAKEDKFGFKWVLDKQVPSPEPVLLVGKLKTHNGTYVELSDIKRGAGDTSIIIQTGIIGDIRQGDGTRFSLSWTEIFDKEIQNHQIAVFSKDRVTVEDGEEVTILGTIVAESELYILLIDIKRMGQCLKQAHGNTPRSGT